MATSLCDQHYSRMIYETCVILNNAYYSTGQEDLVPNIYRKHYYNHPQCRWARTSTKTFAMTLRYLEELLESYVRHGGKAWLKEKEYITWYKGFPPTIPNQSTIPPPYLTFGNKDNYDLNQKYKAIQAQFGIWCPDKKVWTTDSWDTAIEAYRTYYRMKIFKGGYYPKWTHNTQPDWYIHTDIDLIANS